MKEIEQYTNFNISRRVTVSVLEESKEYSAAVCVYRDADLSGFFLFEDTITYVVEGEKLMMIANQEYRLQKGDLLYIPAQSIVFTHIPYKREAFKSLNIKLYQSTHQGPWKHPQLFKKSTRLKVKIEAVLRSRYKKNTLAYNAASIEPLLVFLKQQRTDTTIYKAPNRLISKALTNLMIENVFEPFNLSELASMSHMSLATFKRKFKACFQLPPKTWIRNIRLQAAYFYLNTKQCSISEVATFVGFDNGAHFSYAFKKYHCKTPSSVFKKN